MKRSWLRRGSALSLAGIIMLASAGQAVYATDNGARTEDNKATTEQEDKIELEKILKRLEEIKQSIEEVNKRLGEDELEEGQGKKGILGQLRDIETEIPETKIDGAKGLIQPKQVVEDQDSLDLIPLVPSENLEEKPGDDSKTNQDIEEDTKDIEDEVENPTNQNQTGDLEEHNQNLDKTLDGQTGSKSNEEDGEVGGGKPIDTLKGEDISYSSRQNQLLAYQGVLLAAGDGETDSDDLIGIEPSNQVKEEMDSIKTNLEDINENLGLGYDAFIDIALEIMAKKEAGVDFEENPSSEIVAIKVALEGELNNFKNLEEELSTIKNDLENLRQDNPIIENYTLFNPKTQENDKVIDLAEDEIFNAEQRLDSIVSSFSGLAGKNIRLVSSLGDLENLSGIDLAIFNDTVRINNASENPIVKGKPENGKTRFIFKRSFNQDGEPVENFNQPFFEVDGNKNLSLENIILDGGGFAGGIESNGSLHLKDIDFVNHKGYFVISIKAYQTTIKTEFTGDINFIKNNTHNTIEQANGDSYAQTMTSFNKGGNEGKVNFIDNRVEFTIIYKYSILSISNLYLNSMTFKLPVNFIGNRSIQNDRKLINNGAGTINFEKEAKFINNSFSQGLVYNESESQEKQAKIKFDRAAFINNQVASNGGAIIWDHKIDHEDDEGVNRIQIKEKGNDVSPKYTGICNIVDGSDNIYNPAVYENLLILENKVNGKSNEKNIVKNTRRKATSSERETIYSLPNMKKEFSFQPNGGRLVSGSLGPFELLNIKTPTLVREGYDFSYWSPSPYNIEKISKDIKTKDSQALINIDLKELYGDFTVKNIFAQWSKLERPSSGGGGGGSSSSDRDKDKQDNKVEEDKKIEEPEKEPEQLINGRPVSEVIKDYENASGEAKRELREQLMGVTIEEGLEYKFKKEQHAAYLEGYKDDTFKPHQYVTREEAASVIMRILEPRFIEEVETDQHDFKDLEKGRWSEVAIATLANGEIMNGYGDGTFRPTRYISRAELSRTVSRFTDIIIEETKFEDIIAHWAEDYINSARREGWINGYEDGSFKPDSLITRAELTALVNSILERRVNRENILPGAKTYSDLEYDKWYYPVIMEAINGHHHDINEKKDGTEIWLNLIDESFF